jgi:hypothetical protein
MSQAESASSRHLAWSQHDVEPWSQPYLGTVAPAARNDGSALIHDLYRFASADQSASTRSGVEILEADLRNEIVIVLGNDGLWKRCGDGS